jgi:hypothetical protein
VKAEHKCLLIDGLKVKGRGISIVTTDDLLSGRDRARQGRGRGIC